MKKKELGITPGIWGYCPTTVNPEKFNFSVITFNERGCQSVVDVYRQRSWDGKKSEETPEVSEANARLISAAPELYEAAFDLVKMLKEAKPGGWMMDTAYTILNKDGRSVLDCFHQALTKAQGIDYSKITDIEFDGIDSKDAPDYVDAHIVSALYDGREMTEDELHSLDSEFVHVKLTEYLS